MAKPSERQAIDQRPGSMPDIRADAGSVIFILAPAQVPHHARLLIRCDPDGELWVSIAPRTTERPGTQPPGVYACRARSAFRLRLRLVSQPLD